MAGAAERYARALFHLAEEEGQTSALHAELRELGALLTAHPPLRRALLQPLYPAAERRAVLDALAERHAFHPVLRNFCSYLIDQRRLIDLAQIEACYGRLIERAAGVAKALLRTPTPLDDAQQARLCEALAARTGQPVTLEVVVDEALLGGLVVQVGDTVLDGSLQTHLTFLIRTLVHPASLPTPTRAH